MGVIHQQESISWKNFQVLGQRSSRTVAGKHAIGQQDNFCVWATALNRACRVLGLAMFELENRAIEKARGIAERGVRFFVKQRMREVTRQRLPNDQVGHVTAGKQERVLGAKKITKTFFQLLIEG